MDVLSKWLNAIRAHLRSASRPSRVVGLFLVAMVVAGVVLLVASGGRDDRVPVGSEALSAEALAAAKACLEDLGIDHRVESGRLLVLRKDLARVRAILSRRRLLGGEAASAFEKLADEEDIWLTQAQSAKRWQAAKMGELSRLIGDFPPVLRATVILESGSPRRLGAPAVSPTAAVQVTMKEGARMTETLARAAADLVAGSVAGMKASDVRIVDSSGQSFRVSDDGPATRPAGEVVVSGRGAAGPEGARNPFGGSLWPGRGPEAGQDRGYTGAQVAAIVLILVAAATTAVAGAAWLILRRQRRRDSAARAAADEDEADEAPSEPEGEAPAAQPRAASRFAFLQAVGPTELAGLLELEHPQTLAIILAHLPAASGGAVLAGLSESKRIEVVRRVVDLSQIDPTVVAEIERALSSRLAEAGRRQEVCGGLTAITEMLQCAGYATEKLVLEALEVQRPALAERIRHKLLVFEDLAKVPASTLRVVLVSRDREELAVALRTAGRDLKRQLLSCLPGRMARQVRREMEQMGPVRLSDVEAAQQRIVDAVRHLSGEEHRSPGAPEAAPFVA